MKVAHFDEPVHSCNHDKYVHFDEMYVARFSTLINQQFAALLIRTSNRTVYRRNYHSSRLHRHSNGRTIASEIKQSNHNNLTTAQAHSEI
jgi:hypothetical protein